ncbi:MAG: flagellar hook assembly protein FlgD [Burkholderiales bacterium]|nr:flagellar hook assembly protein FlgD [Burkholderiales bacterium]
MAEMQSSAVSLAALTAPQGSGAPKSAVEETQERFLKLLVTQMRNQDPLNPLDNAQVTTQLAQLNTVTGISQLNETLQGIAAGFAASQVLQATPLVGRDVMVAGSRLALADGHAPFAAELKQPVDNLRIDILDAAGRLVHRADTGPQQAGLIALAWDGAADGGGSAAPGSYRFVLSATAGGKAVGATALAIARVTGVAAAGGSVTVNLSTGEASRLADIKQVF